VYRLAHLFDLGILDVEISPRNNDVPVDNLIASL
tara:strand:- start:191 stop:292 length:102 start_codon:yes stop_codon:yes gene_type:complete